MLEGLRRSIPSRRMQVRMPKPPSMSKPSAHQSFKLTKPVKQKFIQSGFGSYTPESFKETLKHADPKTASSKEEAFFLQHAKSDKTLTTKTDIEKFSEGFLEEAHDTGAKLRSGLNIRRSGSEQGRRLVKEYEKKSVTPDARKHNEQKENHQRLNTMRERLGIQHGPTTGPTPSGNGINGGVQEPTPIPTSSWSTEKGTSNPTAPAPGHNTPSLGATILGFVGGRISQNQPSTDTTAFSATPDFSGPTITAPVMNAVVSVPFRVEGISNPGRTIRIFLDQELLTSIEPTPGAGPKTPFTFQITQPIPLGDHELQVAEYIAQIRQAIGRPIRLTVIPPPTTPATSEVQLPDPNSVHELAI